MEPMLKGAAPAAPPPADLIKDSDQTKFAKDVLEASRTVPVIVDFWAPWCGPCKTLQPIIEKVVIEAKGAIKLVKINIDQNQMLAQQLRIQSIPAVYAFKGGRPVDGFVGALDKVVAHHRFEEPVEDLPLHVRPSGIDLPLGESAGDVP